MVANSSNLIITFKPANQRTLTSPRRGSFSRTSQLSSGSHHTNHTNTSDELEQDDQDEIVDLTGITLDDNAGALQPQQHHPHQLTAGGGGVGSGTPIVESRDGVLHLWVFAKFKMLTIKELYCMGTLSFLNKSLPTTVWRMYISTIATTTTITAYVCVYEWIAREVILSVAIITITKLLIISVRFFLFFWEFYSFQRPDWKLKQKLKNMAVT